MTISIYCPTRRVWDNAPSFGRRGSSPLPTRCRTPKDWTSMRSLCVKALVHACGETYRDLSTSLHRRLFESGSSEKLDKDRINLAFSFSSADVYSLLRLFSILPSLMSNAKAEWNERIELRYLTSIHARLCDSRSLFSIIVLELDSRARLRPAVHEHQDENYTSHDFRKLRSPYHSPRASAREMTA